jgi:hypothetical protein
MDDIKGNVMEFINSCGKSNNDLYNEFDPRIRRYLIPKSILWTSVNSGDSVENAQTLLEKHSRQITLASEHPCILRNNGDGAGMLLDFGIEIHGSIQIFICNCAGAGNSVRIRIRFGESAMEAMSEMNDGKYATNDHSLRDQIIEVGSLSAPEIGPSGFRFVRIDLVDENSYVEIKSVKGIFIYRDIEYKGNFHCNDERLNKIWYTGAYTVHLNMQEYLWDGIKRDRLIWVGDMHPEVSAIQAVFGYNEVVPKSLDLIRDITPMPQWMNTVSSYSIWWLLIHYGWYMHNGDLEYLREQKEYMSMLLHMLLGCIGEDNGEHMPETRFLDWASSGHNQSIHTGLHAMLVMALNTGADMCKTLGDTALYEKCVEGVIRLRKYKVDCKANKQAAALTILAGLADPGEINTNVLAVNGYHGISTFMGYYILQARAMAGDIKDCLDCIRDYWGGMLDFGATTFWEDFNLDWTMNAEGIDKLVPNGKKDIHGDFGEHCYKGYRKSLCHGWAAGPTAWLSEHVMGIKIKEPGCRIVEIKPDLGDLEWAEGRYPTPAGVIEIEHRRDSDGNIKSKINAPKEIKIV